MNKAKAICVCLVIFSMISLTGQSQGENRKVDNARNIFELWSEDEVLEIKITLDLDSLVRTKYSDQYVAAIVQKKTTDEQHQGWKVKIRARGNHRRKICDIPPVKINFDKAEFESENLTSHKSLKLVTHCNDLENAEELLLKEYLVYKIYNIITDESLRVQLAKIEWIDNKGIHNVGKKWGFVIENEKEMSQRIGAVFVDTFAIESHRIDAKNGARVSLFQYMIGNPDWKIAPVNNLSVMRSEALGALFTIPYDFDFCGIVDAPYAVAQFGLKSVQERIYLGDSTEEEISIAKKLFRTKKRAIFDEVRSCELLSRSAKKDMINYLRSFFSKINEPLKRKAYYKERLIKR